MLEESCFDELKYFLNRFDPNEPSPLADFAASLTTANREALQEILETVFGQTDLDYEFVDAKYILLTKRSEQHDLDYLCGYILEDGTSTPVTYATVYTENGKKGVETNLEGYFKINVERNQRYVFVSFLGYNTLKIDLRRTSSDPCPQFILTTESVSMETIILREYLADGINQTQNANTVVIEPDAMSIMPGSVEKDVLAAIRFLPGITSPTESLDGVHVRGGTPDQNLILWDGIPMYHTSHFFGTISAFNPNIIDNVSNVSSDELSLAVDEKLEQVIRIGILNQVRKQIK